MTRPARRLILAACLLLAACQSTPSAPPAPTPSASLSLATDPCAIRLHDIQAAMLLYFAINKRLPDTLEELRPFADSGADLTFTCPASGKPYVYAPDGLWVPDQPRRLVLYDATSAHNGKRWGVVITPPAPGQTFTALVIPLDEPVLKAYQQSATTQP